MCLGTLAFFYGLVVAALGRLELTDSIQMILLGSPLFAVVVLSDFSLIIGNLVVAPDGRLVNNSTARFLQTVVYAFIVALFIIYSKGLFRTERVLSPDRVKILTGSVETVLGRYIAAIRDRLFVPPT